MFVREGLLGGLGEANAGLDAACECLEGDIGVVGGADCAIVVRNLGESDGAVSGTEVSKELEGGGASERGEGVGHAGDVLHVDRSQEELAEETISERASGMHARLVVMVPTLDVTVLLGDGGREEWEGARGDREAEHVFSVSEILFGVEGEAEEAVGTAAEGGGHRTGIGAELLLEEGNRGKSGFADHRSEGWKGEGGADVVGSRHCGLRDDRGWGWKTEIENLLYC